MFHSDVFSFDKFYTFSNKMTFFDQYNSQIEDSFIMIYDDKNRYQLNCFFLNEL